MSVQIIVDSTVDMPERIKKHFRIVPLTVHFGTEEFIDGVTIDKKRFYERLVESDVLPTTSQATPAAFQKEFEEVDADGDSAVVIPPSMWTHRINPAESGCSTFTSSTMGWASSR